MRSIRSITFSIVNTALANRWLVLLTLATFIACTALVLLCGCSAGRNDATGEIVVGVGVAKLVETTNQAVAQVVDKYLPGVGTVASIFGVPLVGAAIGWARSANKAATLAGKERGWDERETAATVQQPLAVPPAAQPGATT